MFLLLGDFFVWAPCIRLSVCPSALSHLKRFSTGAEWLILVLGFAKYSKRSSEAQVSYSLEKHHRVFILRGIQNGWAFKIMKMVAVSTGCAIAVDHAFNLIIHSYLIYIHGKY